MRINQTGQILKSVIITDSAMQVMAKRMASGKFVKETDKLLNDYNGMPFKIKIDTIKDSNRLKAVCQGSNGESCDIIKEGYLRVLISPQKLINKVHRVAARLSYTCQKLGF